MDGKSGYLLEKLPKSEVEDLTLEEVPDIDYEDIGGLTTQIESIKDAVELPYLYSDYYKEHHLAPPKGVLAVRAAGLRQDDDRQGGGQQPGRADLGEAGGEGQGVLPVASRGRSC